MGQGNLLSLCCCLCLANDQGVAKRQVVRQILQEYSFGVEEFVGRFFWIDFGSGLIGIWVSSESETLSLSSSSVSFTSGQSSSSLSEILSPWSPLMDGFGVSSSLFKVMEVFPEFSCILLFGVLTLQLREM